MEKADKRREEEKKKGIHQGTFITTLSCHSSPMAVLMIAALFNLAASSNLVTASLQDLSYNRKAVKLGSAKGSHRVTD